MIIDGHFKNMALIGSPVSHSMSPQMYNYCFEKLGLPYVYTAIDIKEADAAKAFEAFKLMGFHGGNVTMPCKTAAYACMDEVHQIFVPGRAGRFTDVLVDSIGIALGVVLCALSQWAFGRKKHP